MNIVIEKVYTLEFIFHHVIIVISSLKAYLRWQYRIITYCINPFVLLINFCDVSLKFTSNISGFVICSFSGRDWSPFMEM